MPDATPAAGPALDAEVARVMGLVPCDDWEEINFGSGGGPALRKRCTHVNGACYPSATAGSIFGRVGGCPAYSTDIAAAWLVVKHLRSKGFTTTIDICAHDCNGKEFTCVFADENSAADELPEWASAEMMPLAIALAALRALGREEDGDGL